MSVTVRHLKVNQIPNWTQADIDKQIALGNLLPGTTPEMMTLASDWNDDHEIDGGFGPNPDGSYTANEITYGDGSSTLAQDPNFQYDGYYLAVRGIQCYDNDYYGDGFFRVDPQNRSINLGDTAGDYQNTYIGIDDNSAVINLNANSGYNFTGGLVTFNNEYIRVNSIANIGGFTIGYSGGLAQYKSYYNGRTVYFYYDGNGLITSKNDGINNWTYSYDGNGLCYEVDVS